MKIKYFFSLAILWLTLPWQSLGLYQTFDLDYPEITAPNAILVDASYDNILFEQNAYDLVYPASTTKVMTAMLVCEAIDLGIVTLETVVTAQEESTIDLASDGSSQGIHPGEEMTVKDLLYCLMLASANEAGNILALAVTDTLPEFHQMMNDKAAALGCTGTNYVNTHGLHKDEHYTTAYDQYLILKAAMENPLFAEITGTATYTTAATNREPERTFYNTNGLLSEWYYRGYTYANCVGGKTGTTPEAGRCLVSAAKSGNEYVIAVVMGTQAVKQDDGSTLLPHLSESRTLLQFGIDEFDRRIISPDGEPVGQIPVTLSDENDAVLIKAQGEIELTLPISMDLSTVDTAVSIEVETMEAPVTAGTVVGSMTISYQGETYGTVDVVTMHDVARSDILYQKQQMESFVSNYGLYMVGGVMAMGGLVLVGNQMTNKRRRRHSWRNNQKNRYKSRK